MSWKLIVLTGFVIIGGAIITAAAKPWESGTSGGSGGTKITSYATCVKVEQQSTTFGPSAITSICRAMGWRP